MRGISRRAEKWIAGILAVVCAVLVANLVFHSGIMARAERPSGEKAPARAQGRAHQTSTVARANNDQGLDLELLKDLQNRPLPHLNRNPFEFPPPPALKTSQTSAAQPAGPPPPPPLPLRAIGYSEQNGGPPQAVVTDAEDIFVVHAGEKFGKRYTVVSLSPTKVEIHDALTQQTAELPIAP